MVKAVPGQFVGVMAVNDGSLFTLYGIRAIK
jgi:hypothetical protein